MDDPEVPYRVGPRSPKTPRPRRSNLDSSDQDRAAEDDPVMRFFEDAFSDPNNWEKNPPQPAIEDRVLDPTPSLSRLRSSIQNWASHPPRVEG
jgi:hypothetical protein